MSSELDDFGELASSPQRARQEIAAAWSTTSRARAEQAELRDLEADARDAAADARDGRDEALEAEVAQRQRLPIRGGIDLLLRAARDRKLAAASQERASAARDQAAHDRAMAAHDRTLAAEDRRAAAEDLAREGFDHLTGALRRGAGLAAIRREVDRTHRTGESLVIAFVDIDGLKAINDSRGHEEGDEHLRAAVRCIEAALRPYDVILRYGGDEFVCSLAMLSLEAARDRFDAIGTRLAGERPGATLTVGLAERRRTETADELIARADRAMLARRT